MSDSVPAKDLLEDRLRRLAPFHSLAAGSDAAWLDALRRADEVVMPPETVMLCKGDTCRGFLLPYRGTIRVQQASKSGREVVLYRVHPGEICILALTSLLDGVSYTAEAVTDTEVHGLNIPLQQFERALADSNVFRRYVLTTMAKRLRDLAGMIEEVLFQRLDNRLACLLCQLFEQHGADTIEVTHQSLAAELGTTREVVSRLLKDIEQSLGCIRLQRGRIELLSRETLAAHARRSVM
jgi:CRP/FNR family transcriptional regulator